MDLIVPSYGEPAASYIPHTGFKLYGSPSIRPPSGYPLQVISGRAQHKPDRRLIFPRKLAATRPGGSPGTTGTYHTAPHVRATAASDYVRIRAAIVPAGGVLAVAGELSSCPGGQKKKEGLCPLLPAVLRRYPAGCGCNATEMRGATVFATSLSHVAHQFETALASSP